MAVYSNALEKFSEEHRLRFIPEISPEGTVDMLSNDYLGLGANSAEYIDEFHGRFPDALMSSSASRLLSRKNKYHNQLENYLGQLYGRSALLFNSGYHANVGMLQALAVPGTLFLADKLCHASELDGILLSGADYKRYPHNSIQRLKRVLKKEYDAYDRIVIVTESVFSMDGDIVRLKELVDLKKKFPKIILYLDEAHSFGVMGNRGLGLAEELGLIEKVDIIVGTLGKAAASQGAFAITSETLKKYFINTARTFIFSTALPPAQAAWSLLMVEKITEMHEKRLHLHKLSAKFVKDLNRKLNIESPSKSHIVPIMIGDATEAMLMADFLTSHGYDCLAIRKPTVPKGSERLRISLNANLSKENVEGFIETLGKY